MGELSAPRVLIKHDFDDDGDLLVGIGQNGQDIFPISMCCDAQLIELDNPHAVGVKCRACGEHYMLAPCTEFPLTANIFVDSNQYLAEYISWWTGLGGVEVEVS